MKFELRTLNASDIFPMSTILSKIGLNEFKHCFEPSEIKKLMGGAKGNEAVVGMGIMFEVANIILTNLHKCETDVYRFLASVANVDVDEIKNLPLADFAELIIDLVQKPEFKDFFSVVSRLFKSKK